MDGPAAKKKAYSRADFLAWEERQKERYEFLDGIVTMMAGGSRAHDVIAGNIFARLHAALRGKGCRPFQHNRKLVPPGSSDATYPDVMVVCAKEADDATRSEEATVIVEVSSPGTSKRDRELKWKSYRHIDQLRHYLVVEQDRPRIVMYSRTSDEAPWHEHEIDAIDATVDLAAIRVKLPMAQVYEGVDL
jgi:Uma2 family endonuclease